MQWLLNSDQSYVFCYQMLHNWPATSASYFIIHQINQFDQFMNLTRFQFCRANSILSTAATILSYLTKVPLVSVTSPFILSIIFTFPYKVKFERNSLMIFMKIGSLPQQKGEKRWIQIKLHVPSVARMLPLFTREKGNLQFCNVKVFQNILFTSKAAAISITPRYNILCTQRSNLLQLICLEFSS